MVYPVARAPWALKSSAAGLALTGCMLSAGIVDTLLSLSHEQLPSDSIIFQRTCIFRQLVTTLTSARVLKRRDHIVRHVLLHKAERPHHSASQHSFAFLAGGTRT
jgi:hypothetical protein